MRDYQVDCIKTIKEHFKKNDRQLIQLPTGSGKTWIFTRFLKENSNSALIVCPSIELKEQIFNTFKLFNIKDVAIGLNNSCKYNIVTNMSFSKDNSLDIVNKKKFQYIVIDEAHHAQSKSNLRLINSLNFNPKILGCTATPERLDGKSLLEIFHTLTYKKNIFELIDVGFLSDVEAYKYKTGIRISKRAEDFRQIELRDLDKDSRNEIILKIIKEQCFDKKTLVFCLNIEHSIKIALMLNQMGFSAGYVYGEMPKQQRIENLKKFKSGELQFITNCQLLTEGFDEPSIEAIVLTRPTCSKALYCQMVGRGLRITKDKKVCYLHELADNNHKLCTFNVTCDKEPEFQHDYQPGIRLSQLYKELEENVQKYDLENLEVQRQKHNLFLNEKTHLNNEFNIFKSEFYSMEMNERQGNILKSYGIQHNELNFIEAAFLIWKHNLKKKYGYL